MEQYTIYCSKEQTRKALELGAPIIKAETRYDLYNNTYCFINGIVPAVIIPTAEEMIGWLESTFSIRLLCGEDTDGKIFFNVYNQQECISEINGCDSRKEATIEAINAALDYLIRNKK